MKKRYKENRNCGRLTPLWYLQRMIGRYGFPCSLYLFGFEHVLGLAEPGGVGKDHRRRDVPY